MKQNKELPAIHHLSVVQCLGNMVAFAVQKRKKGYHAVGTPLSASWLVKADGSV